MVAGRRRVVWSAIAKAHLDDILDHIAIDSRQGARRVASACLSTADSLADLAHRGRIVPELQAVEIRELFVFRYRLIYRVEVDRVTILAVVHGARDFMRAWREQPN